MNNLRVTLIQSKLHWENIAANLEMFSKNVETINNTDLIILPEMFSTGFSMRASELAEDAKNSSAIEWMRKTAAEKNCAITGSLMLRDKKKFHNRLIWMKPDGTFEKYDKRHLFSISEEPKVYTPGDEKIIVELNGWKICPLICYDLRFPVWSRNAVNNPRTPAYDLLLYVANWPEKRIHAWKQLLVARAIENLSYVIGVNRVGEDGNNFSYSGDSMVVDAMGGIMYHKERDEDVFTIELNYEELKKVRKNLPFLKDADEFVINPKTKFKSH